MKLLTDIEVCEILGLSISTLRKWRNKKKGPTFVKFGTSDSSAVRYPESELEKFVARHIKHSSRKEDDELETKEVEIVEEADEFDYYL